MASYSGAVFRPQNAGRKSGYLESPADLRTVEPCYLAWSSDATHLLARLVARSHLFLRICAKETVLTARIPASVRPHPSQMPSALEHPEKRLGTASRRSTAPTRLARPAPDTRGFTCRHVGGPRLPKQRAARMQCGERSALCTRASLRCFFPSCV